MLETFSLVLAFLVNDFDVFSFTELFKFGVGQKFVDQSFLSIFFRDSVRVEVDGGIHHVTNLETKNSKNLETGNASHCIENLIYGLKSYDQR